MGRRNTKCCWCKVMSKWLHNGGTSEYPATWRGVVLVNVIEDVESCEVPRVPERVLRSAIVHPPAQKSPTMNNPVASEPVNARYYHHLTISWACYHHCRRSLNLLPSFHHHNNSFLASYHCELQQHPLLQMLNFLLPPSLPFSTGKQDSAGTNLRE